MTDTKTRPYADRGDDASKKTAAYGNETGKTRAYEDEAGIVGKTVGYESEQAELTDKTVAHNLGVDDAIELNGKDYKITGIISGDDRTGEAVIYKIMDKQGKPFALKLYYKFTNPKDEPNPEALTRIKRINDPDILNLVDFGTGTNKYLDKFCYEISDFAEGANLISVSDIRKKYTTEFLRSNVIPEIFKGIRTLHDYKIYHCDLKPENIVYLDKDQTDLVIGDYGSAKTFEETSEKQLTHTSTTKGTSFYLAPEQPRGVVSEKNNYYSFGMILLHLLYPDLVNRKSLHKIVERQFSRKPIIDFKPEHEEMNYLIAGLTLNDIGSRWGEEEVKAWLRGEEVEVRYTSEAEVRVQPINLGKTVIRTVEDIINYIENNSEWYENLIEDNEGYTLLLRWVSDLQGVELKKVFDKMVRSYQQDGKDYVYQAILRYFEPQRPVQVDMKTYDFWGSENVTELTASFVKHIDDIWKITELKKIKFYMFQLEFVLRQIETEDENLKVIIGSILDKISSALECSLNPDFDDFICKLYPEVSDKKLINLFYLFDEERKFKDLENKTYDTLKDIGFLFAKDKNGFNNKYLKIERDYFFEINSTSHLKGYGYNDLLFEIFKDKTEPEIKFEDINVTDKNNTLKYNLYKSLSKYFADNGINNNLSYGDKETFKFPFEGKFIYNKFKKFAEEKQNIKFSLLSDNNEKEFIKNVNKNRKIQFRLFKINRHYEALKKNYKVFSAIGAILVFICFALNWEDITKTIYNSITGIFPPINSLPDSLVKWSGSLSIVRKLLAFIPICIVVILIYILYGIGALIIGAFSLLFPVIAVGIIFKISNGIFKSLFKNNDMYPKTITAIYIIIILVLSGITIKEANILPQNLLASFYQNSLITHSEDNRITVNSNSSAIIDSTNTKPIEALNLSTIATGAANLRSGPSTQHQILTVIKKGDKFEILSSKNGWNKIHFNGKDGYISNKLIQKVKN